MESLLREIINAKNEDELYLHCLEEVYRRYLPEHCLIARFDQNNADTLAYLHCGKLQPNFKYPLSGTPCDIVQTKLDICLFSEHIQQQFPYDKALRDLNAESYLGIPLLDQDGNILGVLALLYDHCITKAEFDHDWLLTLGYLIGKNIVQQLLMAEKTTLLKQFERSEAIANIGSWRWDVKHNQFCYSKHLAQIFSIDEYQDLLFSQFFCQHVFRHSEDFQNFISDTCSPNIVSTLVINKEDSIKGLQLEIAYTKYYDSEKKLKSIEGTIRNITYLSELENQHYIANEIIELSGQGVIITNKNNKIMSINSQVTDITGYTHDDLIGQCPSIFSSNLHDHSFYADMWSTLRTVGRWEGEVWNQTKSGALYPESLSISVIKNIDGDIKNYIAVFDDLSAQKNIERELFYYKNSESVTGLITRSKFIQHIERNLTGISVIVFDISHFSTINNTYGESFGNKILRYVAQNLQTHLKDEAVVSRYGADQFAISVNSIESHYVEAMVDRIQAIIETAFIIEGHSIKLNINVGYSTPLEDSITTHPLTQAKFALDEAKVMPLESSVRYSKFLEENVVRRQELSVKLRKALEQGRLHVEYQPIVNLTNNQIVKFEALARWTEDGVPISPVEFIPIAEQFGYITKLGKLILTQVCQDILLFKARGHNDIVISINRSIEELAQEDPNENSISAMLNVYGLTHEDLVIEITESIPLEDKPAVQDLIAKLRKKGLKVALDDFGTGFASFSNLMKSSVDILKIDRSFIKDIETDKNNAVLVESVNMLATQLGLNVIAEGVETESQMNILRQMGCCYAQGYYISRPVPLEQALALVE